MRAGNLNLTPVCSAQPYVSEITPDLPAPAQLLQTEENEEMVRLELIYCSCISHMDFVSAAIQVTKLHLQRALDLG